MTGIVEVFAGPGGWSQAIAAQGLSALIGFDASLDACVTARQAGHPRWRTDVRDMPHDELETYRGADGLIISAPCPAFSIAGLHGAREDVHRLMDVARMGLVRTNPVEVPRYGWADNESALILEVLRWVQAVRPGWVACEQVPRAAQLFHRFAGILRQWGYATSVFNMDAVRLGVPQQRERVFLLASLDRQPGKPAFTHREFNLRKATVDETLPRSVSMHDAIGIPADALVGSGRPADRMNEVDAILLNGEWKRRRDFRLASLPSKTITGKSKFWWQWLPTIAEDDYMQGPQLTAAQTGQLQTFPVDYPWHGSDSSIAQQIGNAVPPLMASAVLAEVLPTKGPPQ